MDKNIINDKQATSLNTEIYNNKVKTENTDIYNDKVKTEDSPARELTARKAHQRMME